MNTQKVYIILYKFYDTSTCSWISKVSQEGYFNLDDARKFCEDRCKNSGVSGMYFQNITPEGIYEEYYICEVILK